MVSKDKPEVLLWDVQVVEADGAAVYGALDVEEWPVGTRFAVLGNPEGWPYLYVVSDDATRLVTVLAMVDVAEAALASDAEARIPQAGVWLWLPERGKMRVVGSPALLTRDAIADLLGGHSPPPVNTDTKTS